VAGDEDAVLLRVIFASCQRPLNQTLRMQLMASLPRGSACDFGLPAFLGQSSAAFDLAGRQLRLLADWSHQIGIVQL
jgi:hypothetical protein